MIEHYFDPETEQQSTQLKYASSLLLQKNSGHRCLAGKLMTRILGCYDGGIFGERSHFHW
jgi:hypothetical protein